VTYAPSYQKTHALAKAADFDKRLTLLEKALGISSSAFPQLDSTGRPTPAILPTLDTITRQLSVLSESSAASLDAVSRRVRQLTQEAEKLAEARKAAKAAQDALKTRERNGEATPTGGGTGGETSVVPGIEDPEQVAKINALYGTLTTIESLSPMLPAVLDRLRSLRAIHADAAMASEALTKVEKRQEEMAEEVKRWREGLEKLEGAMKEGEGVMGSNMKVVEGWVRELEKKLEGLGR
jgi:nuclear migration protein JNM1